MRPIRIVEVGPRDGLQNEAVTLAVDDRVELIERLFGAGLRSIEVGSFVRADRIPQMAGSADVFARVRDLPGIKPVVLAPNERGLNDARDAGAPRVAVFVAASDEFNRRNINKDTAAGLEDARRVCELARGMGMTVRGYVSTIAGCPYQGDVAVGDVVNVTRDLVAMGCDEVSMGDTIGIGTPARIREVVRAVSTEVDPDRLAIHAHDTYGMAVANALAALSEGVRTIDASAGGLGGCPFAGEGAKGNVATEDVLYALAGEDVEGSPDLDAVIAASWWLAGLTGHPPRSLVATAKSKKK